MFKKTKELQGLVNASRTDLKRAERRLEDYKLSIKNFEEQAKIQYEEKKKLEEEIEKQNDLIKRIKFLLRVNKYGNEKVIIDKIKELVNDYQN